MTNPTTPVAAEVEKMARAMYAAWPSRVVNAALAVASGHPVGTELTYDEVLELGGSHDGLLKLARAALTSLPNEREKIVQPHTATELRNIIREWLDAEDATQWGEFEQNMDALISRAHLHPTPQKEG